MYLACFFSQKSNLVQNKSFFPVKSGIGQGLLPIKETKRNIMTKVRMIDRQRQNIMNTHMEIALPNLFLVNIFFFFFPLQIFDSDEREVENCCQLIFIGLRRYKKTSTVKYTFCFICLFLSS